MDHPEKMLSFTVKSGNESAECFPCCSPSYMWVFTFIEHNIRNINNKLVYSCHKIDKILIISQSIEVLRPNKCISFHNNYLKVKEPYNLAKRHAWPAMNTKNSLKSILGGHDSFCTLYISTYSYFCNIKDCYKRYDEYKRSLHSILMQRMRDSIDSVIFFCLNITPSRLHSTNLWLSANEYNFFSIP